MAPQGVQYQVTILAYAYTKLGPHGAVLILYKQGQYIKCASIKLVLILLFYYNTSMLQCATFSAKIISSRLCMGCGRQYIETQ